MNTWERMPQQPQQLSQLLLTRRQTACIMTSASNLQLTENQDSWLHVEWTWTLFKNWVLENVPRVLQGMIVSSCRIFLQNGCGKQRLKDNWKEILLLKLSMQWCNMFRSSMTEFSYSKFARDSAQPLLEQENLVWIYFGVENNLLVFYYWNELQLATVWFFCYIPLILTARLGLPLGGNLKERLFHCPRFY